MGDEFLNISKFAKENNVTVRTLQYYDTINLFKPDHKDENGYRYYTRNLKNKLKIISVLKMIGFSIKEVKEFVDKSPNEISVEIENKKLEIENEVKKNKEIYANLEKLQLTTGTTWFEFIDVFNKKEGTKMHNHKGKKIKMLRKMFNNELTEKEIEEMKEHKHISKEEFEAHLAEIKEIFEGVNINILTDDEIFEKIHTKFHDKNSTFYKMHLKKIAKLKKILKNELTKEEKKEFAAKHNITIEEFEEHFLELKKDFEGLNIDKLSDEEIFEKIHEFHHQHHGKHNHHHHN